MGIIYVLYALIFVGNSQSMRNPLCTEKFNNVHSKSFRKQNKNHIKQQNSKKL